MGFTPTGFTTATAVTTSEMEAEMTLVRDWVNTGIVIGDLSANSLEHTHVYRPETYGFPKQSTEGQTQEVYENTFNNNGLGQPSITTQGEDWDLSTNGDLATERVRTSIFPSQVDTFQPVWVASRRIVVDQTSDVEITCNYSAYVRMTYSASPSVAPNTAGGFILSYTNLANGTRTAINGTGKGLTIEIGDSVATRQTGNNAFIVGGVVADLSAGIYDVALDYVKGAAKSDVAQVIIDNANIIIEVHKQ